MFNKVMPIEISQKLKKLGKFKEGNYQNITFKYLLAFINTLKSTNKLVILYHPTPLLILENGTTLKEQAIDFSIF